MLNWREEIRRKAGQVFFSRQDGGRFLETHGGFDGGQEWPETVQQKSRRASTSCQPAGRSGVWSYCFLSEHFLRCTTCFKLPTSALVSFPVVSFESARRDCLALPIRQRLPRRPLRDSLWEQWFSAPSRTSSGGARFLHFPCSGTPWPMWQWVCSIQTWAWICGVLFPASESEWRSSRSTPTSRSSRPGESAGAPSPSISASSFLPFQPSHWLPGS